MNAQVLTGSSWDLVLYDCMRAKENKTLAIPFLLSFFILCYYIILNLFIGNGHCPHPLCVNPSVFSGAILSNMSCHTDEERLQITHRKKKADTKRRNDARKAQKFVNKCLSLAEALDRLDKPLTTLEEVMKLPLWDQWNENTFTTSPIEGNRWGIEVNNQSLGFLSTGLLPSSCVRRAVLALVNNSYFDFVILLVIIYSTVLLTLMNPETLRDDYWVDFFKKNDIFFIVVFTGEFVLKLIAYGFIWCDNIEMMLDNEHDLKEMMLGNHGVPSYMYDGWNYIDLLVLVVSYMNMFAPQDGPLKTLRLVLSCAARCLHLNHCLTVGTCIATAEDGESS